MKIGFVFFNVSFHLIATFNNQFLQNILMFSILETKMQQKGKEHANPDLYDVVCVKLYFM